MISTIIDKTKDFINNLLVDSPSVYFIQNKITKEYYMGSCLFTKRVSDSHMFKTEKEAMIVFSEIQKFALDKLEIVEYKLLKV